MTMEPVDAVISLDLSPIPLVQLEDGVVVFFTADPSGQSGWAELMGLQTHMGDLDPENADDVTRLAKDLKRILGEFITENKPAWTKAKLGIITLARIMYAYVEKVNQGIPTPPS